LQIETHKLIICYKVLYVTLPAIYSIQYYFTESVNSIRISGSDKSGIAMVKMSVFAI